MWLKSVIREGSKYGHHDIKEIGKLWVHFKDGNKLPVMRMTNSDGIWLREARFHDVKLAESGYHAVSRLIERHNPAWKRAFSKVAHCKEAHENISQGRTCILYRYNDGGIGESRVNKPLRHWKNVKYGNEYHLISKKMRQLYTLRFHAKECFVNHALATWANKNRHRLPKGSGLERITVNGRDYYFARDVTPFRGRHNFCKLTLLAQPDSSDSLYHELTI